MVKRKQKTKLKRLSWLLKVICSILFDNKKLKEKEAKILKLWAQYESRKPTADDSWSFI